MRGEALRERRRRALIDGEALGAQLLLVPHLHGEAGSLADLDAVRAAVERQQRALDARLQWKKALEASAADLA